MKKYEEAEFSKWEKIKIGKMMLNGTPFEGAKKSRYALRRKKRVSQVELRSVND